MKKLCQLLLVLLLSVLFSSCGVLKKLKSRVEIRTEIKTDTVILIKTDTVQRIVKVHITDTAFVENTNSFAKSFYDTTLQKIVLSLKGKIFSVPVQISKITEIKKEDLKIDRKPNYLGWTAGILFMIVLLYLIYLILTIGKKIHLL
jgi:predicted component of type VI protein secretion system